MAAYTNLPVTINVLGSVVDPYGAALRVTSVSSPMNGTAYINADGTVSYIRTPGTLATNDSFTYTITDGLGGTSTATVTIYLQDLPVATLAEGSVAAGGTTTVAPLVNDSDPDGDALTVTALGSCTYGTAVINADGTVTYHANSGTSGHTDYFTYTISDGHGGTSTSTIAIVIL